MALNWKQIRQLLIVKWMNKYIYTMKWKCINCIYVLQSGLIVAKRGNKKANAIQNKEKLDHIVLECICRW